MRILKIIIAALSFICLFACGKNDHKKDQQALHLNILTDPSTLYPQKVRNLPSIFTTRLLFDGLLRVGLNNKVEPAIAESYTVSEDAKIYTFKLRDCYWSNGEKVKSSDFSYAWKKALDPSFPCDYGFHFFVIKNAQKVKKGELPVSEVGIYCEDDNTLIVELEEPTPYFLEVLTFPMFYPICENVDRNNPNWSINGAELVTNGPFKLESWDPNSKMVLSKNNNYWNLNAVKLQSIDLYMVPAATEMQMFEKGDIDWMGSPLSTFPLEAIPTFAKNGKLQKSPFTGTYYIRMNTQNKFLSNHKIRKALSLCVDKARITHLGLAETQNIARKFVPDYLYPAKNEKNMEEDLSLSPKELFEHGLQELGMRKENFSLVYIYSRSDDRNRIIAELLQEQWQKNLGAVVKLESLESKFYFSKIGEKNFDIASGSWIADVPDAINFLENFISKDAKSNATSWENPTFASLLLNARKETDTLKRAKLLQEAEDILLSDYPIIPIYHYNMLYLKNDKLKNVILNDTVVWDVSQAYIEE